MLARDLSKKEIQSADITYSFIPPDSKNANALSGLRSDPTTPPLKSPV
ncbi:hypothetical protein [Helicobacter felis]|nr:hypothetical protein [Helicobacter felis]